MAVAGSNIYHIPAPLEVNYRISVYMLNTHVRVLNEVIVTDVGLLQILIHMMGLDEEDAKSIISALDQRDPIHRKNIVVTKPFEIMMTKVASWGGLG